MAVKIRLRRTGAKHQPSYRVVIADSRSPRDGRFIETIGHYNPRRHDDAGNPELYIDPERALYWLDRGAEASETTRSLLRRARILELRHDRDHGLDVTERLAGMTRKPAKVAVAEAPRKDKATAAPSTGSPAQPVEGGYPGAAAEGPAPDTTPSGAATQPDEATAAPSTGSPAQPAEGGDPEQS